MKRAILIGLVVVLPLGCGGGGGGPTVVPPRVVSTSPVAGGTGVALTSVVTATFSTGVQ